MKENEEKPAITSSKQDITSSREEKKDEAQLIDSIVVNCRKQNAGKGRVNKKEVPWNFCWDFLSPGGCRKGDYCKWIHQAKANLAVPPIPRPHKPPWGVPGGGTHQYSGAHQIWHNVGQMHCGVGQSPYEKVMKTPQFAPMPQIPSPRTCVSNLDVLQLREQFLAQSPSARAKGFIPRVTAKEFSPAGKYHPSNTSAKVESEQVAQGKQLSNLKLSFDPQTTLFGPAAKRKSPGISGDILGKLTSPSSPKNNSFRKLTHSSSAPWGSIRSPMVAQDFQNLSMQQPDRFSPQSVATLPLLMPNVKDMVSYRAAQEKMVFLPPAAFPNCMNSTMPAHPLMPTSTRKRREGGKLSMGPLFPKEPQRLPKLNSSLLSKNLPRDQDHRHNLYLNALSRAGLIPKNVCASGLTGSSERSKLINSRAAPGGGFVDSSNQKKNPAMKSWHDDHARNTVNLNNSNVTQKLNLSKKGIQKTSIENRGQRGDSGYSNVSPSSKKNETGDTTDCLANSVISPSNVFSPPFKVPVIKSRSGRRSRGGRPKISLRAVPGNSASGIGGRGRGDNDPEKLPKFLKRGERVSCERLRGRRRGGYYKRSHT